MKNRIGWECVAADVEKAGMRGKKRKCKAKGRRTAGNKMKMKREKSCV